MRIRTFSSTLVDDAALEGVDVGDDFGKLGHTLFRGLSEHHAETPDNQHHHTHTDLQPDGQRARQ